MNKYFKNTTSKMIFSFYITLLSLLLLLLGVIIFNNSSNAGWLDYDAKAEYGVYFWEVKDETLKQFDNTTNYNFEGEATTSTMTNPTKWFTVLTSTTHVSTTQSITYVSGDSLTEQNPNYALVKDNHYLTGIQAKLSSTWSKKSNTSTYKIEATASTGYVISNATYSVSAGSSVFATKVNLTGSIGTDNKITFSDKLTISGDDSDSKVYFTVILPARVCVTIDLQGGSHSSFSNGNQFTTFYGKSYNFMSSGSKLFNTNPTKPGYSFAGWYTAASGGSQISASTTMNKTSNHTIYARWTPYNYKVDINILNPSGAQDYISGTMTQNGNTGLTDQKDNYLNYNTTWTIKDIKPAAGYYLSSVTCSKGTITDNKNGSYTYRASMTFAPTGGWDDVIEIKMAWETYSIKLDANGGTNSKTISNLRYGNSITLPSSTKEGYTFKGWKYGTSTYQAGSYTVPDFGNNGTKVTFTAQWEKEKYTINFNANGGSVTPTSIVNAEYNSTKTLPTPTRAGYTFSGWKYGSTTYPAGSFTVPDFGNSGISVTFTAQWTANTYNITFNANDGSGTMSNMSMTYDQSKELTANKFTKEGYYFIGWKINYASAGEFVKGVGINVSTGAMVTSSNYASHYNLIPFVNNTGSDIQLTSNYSICGIYAYKSNGEFIKRCSSYSTTHNIPTGTGFIRIEINITSDLKFDNINKLTIFGPEEVGYKDKASVKNLATSGTATLYAVWLDTWANNVTKPTGTGTKESPYLISSAQELGWLAKQATLGNLSIYAKQTKVINLSGKAWYPIGRSNAKAFMGNYDGQGYEIIGLTIPKIQDAKNTLLYSDLGLFGYTKEGAIIKNVYISEANVSGYNNVGIVVGNATNTTIERVLIKDSEVYSSNRYGAISGYSSNSTIQNNLIYLTSATGNSTQGIYSGSVSKVDGCLIDIAGKRAKVGTTFTDWGKVNNTLLPSIAWISQVEDNKATNDDINQWINKKLK